MKLELYVYINRIDNATLCFVVLNLHKFCPDMSDFCYFLKFYCSISNWKSDFKETNGQTPSVSLEALLYKAAK